MFETLVGLGLDGGTIRMSDDHAIENVFKDLPSMPISRSVKLQGLLSLPLTDITGSEVHLHLEEYCRAELPKSTKWRLLDRQPPATQHFKYAHLTLSSGTLRYNHSPTKQSSYRGRNHMKRDTEAPSKFLSWVSSEVRGWGQPSDSY